MFITSRKTKNAARLAAALTLAFWACASVNGVYAQVAGFASSRPDSAGKAESGSKRILNLNPFKSAAPPELADSKPITQPVASARPIQSVPSRSRQLAAASETKTTKSRVASSKKSRVGAPKSSVSKSAGSAGVASLLLDELEEDFEGASVRQEKEAPVVVERRSVRDSLDASDLELLEDEEADEEIDGELIEEEKETPRVSKSRKSSAVISTDEEDSAEDDEVIEMGLDGAADVESALSTLSEPVEAEQPKAEEGALDSLDSRFDAYRDGGSSSQEESKASKSVDEKVEANVLKASSNGAPLIEIETIGPKKLVVGQESVYKVVVRNEGKQTAHKLVVTTDIPESVAASSMDVQVGAANIENSDERTNAKRCVWNVGSLDPKQERTLSLKLTPTKRVAFELISNFEYERSSARAGVEVQEPILEALIEGRDSIEWGVEDKFRVRLRNVGNGDAENVELFVSTGENKASQKLGVLKAGEEKTIETSIKTVADDYFSIDVSATAAYGVKTSASKKIGVLRGKLDVEVEAPELQFVEGEFDAKIRVRNNGDATLQHVDVVAQIPEGVEPVFCSNQARQNTEKRRVYWSAPFLRPNEETVFSVTCRVNKAGSAKFEVVGVDQTGVVAQAESLMNIESIAVLAMRVKAPKEPVAVGKRCSYELIVENNGTKDAQDVNTGVFLGTGIRPVSIEGDKGVVFEDESKVLFNKIDCLKAGETVTFRIVAEAMAPGNQKVQAMLQSAAEDVSLLSEETTYCYSRVKRGVPNPRKTDLVESPTITAEKDLEETIRK